MLKICEICGDEFETIKFGHNRRFCFNCSPHYTKGDTQAKAYQMKTLRQKVKEQLAKYKGGKCEVCGYNKYIQVLEFHHKDPSQKEFAVSKQLALSNFNMTEYYKEVDKCSLLCSNCHKEAHI